MLGSNDAFTLVVVDEPFMKAIMLLLGLCTIFKLALLQHMGVDRSTDCTFPSVGFWAVGVSQILSTQVPAAALMQLTELLPAPRQKCTAP
jgi:hypothetical protein